MDLTNAKWEEYYGNNHKKIDYPNIVAGGSVSFKRHLGLPMSQQLWEDLVHRLIITGLCIYRPHDTQWAIGWMEGHCCLHLDENDKVLDINFSPYKYHLQAGENCLLV